MNRGLRILVVAQSTALASALMTWLGEAGHELVVVNTFAAAKAHLKTRPDLLITELKLGAYNGLHLVLLGQAVGVRSIVLGATDQVFEQQAAQLGASYLASTGLEAEELHSLLGQAMHDVEAQEQHAYQWFDEGAASAGSFGDGCVPTPLTDLPTGPSRPVVLH